ncbi:DNA-3-methyladenine glycosylase [Lysinibacter sp. HNR]|uniref:DNA-3-methyladenine glycosylase n=1 Tax=Lysinibacter sp. HNR TaxID=3031408 RepID=UPI002435109A|nr:DNA-3-methyladenine glycosylase [Lysinibacter sp. HNR]WGD36507.1 DNA-3-methyladenine glycosylase [Lysinibacter sp. HNR]
MSNTDFLVPTRAFFERDALEVAPELLGALFTTRLPEGTVTVRLTEVEAYHGKGTGRIADPGSHARMGMTPRNEVMFGVAGGLYVYFNYGMHSAVNLVCSPVGLPSAVLFRAGEVVDGRDIARQRRPTSKTDLDLARGPGRFARAVGLRYPEHNGIDALTESPPGIALVRVLRYPLPNFSRGPRTGVGGEGGSELFPWRFWLQGDPTVSPYRRAQRR